MDSILRLRVVVPIKGVGIAFSSRTTSIKVWIVMWWSWVKSMHGVSVLNGRGTIIAVSYTHLTLPTKRIV